MKGPQWEEDFVALNTNAHLYVIDQCMGEEWVSEEEWEEVMALDADIGKHQNNNHKHPNLM